MNYKSKLLILGLVSKIFAAQFSVVSFDGACKLDINGQQIEMKQVDPAIPLYRAEVGAQSGTKYKYVCGSVTDVERTLQGESTHNELIGRPSTVTEMPEFGFPNKKPWNRSIGRTELFDPEYVPIVIIDADQKFFVGEERSVTFNTMTFILKDKYFKFDSVQASGKNYDEDKFQFQVTVPNGGIYNRDVFKFRPSSYDPVFFRQMIYGDIAHAIGNPAHESVAARVYKSDGTGIGLYVLQEDCTSESFIKSAFYGNAETESLENVPQDLGPIYDGSTGADFNNHDPNQLGSFISSKGAADMKTELLELTNKIATLDISNDDAVKDFDENWFELDTLFRALALEYLGGHWDSYWLMTTNFVVYHPPDETEGADYAWSKYKYYFIDQDFDQTFGSNMKASYEALEYPSRTYDFYVNKPRDYWLGINKDVVADDGKLLEPGTRILLDKFLGCDGKQECSTKTYFENHLKNIVQHIFNPVAIGRKVEGYKARLSEEVQWDYNLARLHKAPNSQYQFTYDMFQQNIDGPVGPFQYGIMDWTTKMADLVCKQFQIEYDKVALTPETAANFEVQEIQAGMDYDKDNLASGSFMNTVNVAMVTIATLLSVVLLF